MLYKLFFFSTLFCSLSCQRIPDEPKNENLSSSPIQKQKAPITYNQLKFQIDSTRLVLKKRYSNATTKSSALVETENQLIKSIGTDLYEFWKDTEWDYNGTTTIPKKGTIACGFFVTTVLKDAGVKLNRYKLAVCPSLTMMKELTSTQDIKNLSSLSYNDFVQQIDQYGEGVFIIGLDYHTGFILNDESESWFIHSNYINKQGVIKEKLSNSLALRSSKTRYVTCLTTSRKFLEAWLLH